MDTTYGVGGVAEAHVVLRDDIRPLAVQERPDGSVLVALAGAFPWAGPLGVYGFGLISFSPDGTWDPTYGLPRHGGARLFYLISPTSRVPVYVDDILVDPSGRWVVPAWTDDGKFLVIRTLPDLARDTSFGTDGIVSLDSPDGYLRRGYRVALDREGRILVAGVERRL